MQFLVLMLVILALVAGPQFWVKRVISRYNRPVDRYEASGAQTALVAAGQNAVLRHQRQIVAPEPELVRCHIELSKGKIDEFLLKQHDEER